MNAISILAVATTTATFSSWFRSTRCADPNIYSSSSTSSSVALAVTATAAALVCLAVAAANTNNHTKDRNGSHSGTFTAAASSWFRYRKRNRNAKRKNPRWNRYSFCHPSSRLESSCLDDDDDDNDDLDNENNAATTTASEESQDYKDDDDIMLLQHAHALRESLSKPRLSDFRVVALLLVVLDDDNDRNEIMVIPGANDEPGPFLGGAICAERAAFLQLRAWWLWRQQQQQHQPQPSSALALRAPTANPPKVDRIYIVSDAQTEPLPPGLLCREYMYGHEATTPETVVIMQSSTSSTTTIATTASSSSSSNDRNHQKILKLSLRELYPYPSIYMGWSTRQQQLFGQAVVSAATAASTAAASSYHGVVDDQPRKIRHPRLPNLPLPTTLTMTTTTDTEIYPSITSQEQQVVAAVHPNVLHQVLVAACAAAQDDHRDEVHPIRYGAAAAIWIPEQTPQRPNHNNKDGTSNLGEFRIVSACQQKALEYGATQDAVCQLLPQLLLRVLPKEQQSPQQAEGGHDPTREKPNSNLTIPHVLVQVDQYGIPHAPFAAARSLLVEHGLGHTPCLVATTYVGDPNEVLSGSHRSSSDTQQDDNDKDLIQMHIVLAQDLAPYVPNFRA
ncbi:hypothetical protein ACA910_021237 [Epithemia clementina (nom. ined.)]